MEIVDSNLWKKCSSCKKPIAFLAKYYVCSVSTCNGQRTGYVFCSVPCYEVHLPGARHKDAAAIEMRAPNKADAQREPTRKIIASPAAGQPSTSGKSSLPKDVLIIASRLKDYLQARAEMNTSANVMDVLSDHIRVIADRAIDQAKAEGRKTVMERDFSFLKNLK
jgi:histone H3/H4